MKQIGALMAGVFLAGSAWAHTEVPVAAKFLMAPGSGEAVVPLSASANTIAARGVVSFSQTLYGGFSLAQSATVYIAVRGNSLRNLGITTNNLDLPRVRIFNQANVDLIADSTGNPGGSSCTTGSGASTVSTYYQSRGALDARDFCLGAVFPAGVYTFTVTPTNSSGFVSSPSSGEILFEVTLGP